MDKEINEFFSNMTFEKVEDEDWGFWKFNGAMVQGYATRRPTRDEVLGALMYLHEMKAMDGFGW